MERYGIDAATALRLIVGGADTGGADARGADAGGHPLVGTAGLRSEVMALVYASVSSGERTAAEGRALLERLAALKIRLLGDRVSRGTAWKLALDHGWPTTAGAAEVIAVAFLQADVLVTDDPALADAAAGIVETRGFAAAFGG